MIAALVVTETGRAVTVLPTTGPGSEDAVAALEGKSLVSSVKAVAVVGSGVAVPADLRVDRIEAPDGRSDVGVSIVDVVAIPDERRLVSSIVVPVVDSVDAVSVDRLVNPVDDISTEVGCGV